MKWHFLNVVLIMLYSNQSPLPTLCHYINALCSNPNIAVVMKNVIFFSWIKYLSLDEMTAGSLFSSIVLLLRGEGWEENWLKLALFPLMLSVPCLKKNLNYCF